MSMIRRKAFLSLSIGLVVGLTSPALANSAGARSTKDALESPGDVTRSWSGALHVGERFVEPAAFNDEAILDLCSVTPGDDPHSG